MIATQATEVATDKRTGVVIERDLVSPNEARHKALRISGPWKTKENSVMDKVYKLASGIYNALITWRIIDGDGQIDEKRLAEKFQSLEAGIMLESLMEDPEYAIMAYNDDSIDRYPDLLYEVGLGITSEEEFYLCGPVVHSVLHHDLGEKLALSMDELIAFLLEMDATNDLVPLKPDLVGRHIRDVLIRLIDKDQEVLDKFDDFVDLIGCMNSDDSLRLKLKPAWGYSHEIMLPRDFHSRVYDRYLLGKHKTFPIWVEQYSIHPKWANLNFGNLEMFLQSGYMAACSQELALSTSYPFL
jgi:hypothetical protein